MFKTTFICSSSWKFKLARSPVCVRIPLYENSRTTCATLVNCPKIIDDYAKDGGPGEV